MSTFKLATRVKDLAESDKLIERMGPQINMARPGSFDLGRVGDDVYMTYYGMLDPDTANTEKLSTRVTMSNILNATHKVPNDLFVELLCQTYRVQ